ncbi:MAG: GNAT family N-acetyltransferase [Candidatus Sericytochromatia bacterium]
MRRRSPSLCVGVIPLAAGAPPAPAVPGGEPEPLSTHVLALKPFDELRAGFSRGCKARGNKARKAGLTLRVSRDPADARLYYGLYEDTIKRWGEKLTWARPLAFYERLLAEGGSAVRLFLAEQDGRVVSGLLFAAHGRVAHYVAGATLAEALPLCPSNFLMEEALATYAAEGFETFDFGPSNGLEGVQKFKESFGAEPLAFGAQRAATGSSRLYFALRRPYERLQHWKAHLRDARQSKSASPNPAPAGV